MTTLKELKELMIDVHKEVKNTNNKVDNLEITTNSLVKANELLCKELADYKNKCDGLEKKFNNLESEISNLKKEISVLKK